MCVSDYSGKSIFTVRNGKTYLFLLSDSTLNVKVTNDLGLQLNEGRPCAMVRIINKNQASTLSSFNFAVQHYEDVASTISP